MDPGSAARRGFTSIQPAGCASGATANWAPSVAKRLHGVGLVPGVGTRGPGRVEDPAVAHEELPRVLQAADDEVGVRRVGARASP